MDININKQHNISFRLYPDNQPHVQISPITRGEIVNVECSIKDSLTLVHLMMTANAISEAEGIKGMLTIPYLMGARYDRLMDKFGSFDLKVISSVINSLGFERVFLYDVHSDVSTALINNSRNLPNRNLVNAYSEPNSILICPDAGAAKKVESYLRWNTNIVDVVYCIKHRELSTGKISLKVLEPEKCLGKKCVVIDDICDGGGTFLGIASQIQPLLLTLIVTHGIFSAGLFELKKYYQKIITSDSYSNHNDDDFIEVISLQV